MDNHFSKILPGKIEGWAIAGQDQSYGPDNLYEYINGGAELFLSYGFKQMVTRIYSAIDQPDIIVDVFDMGNSYNAYGVFSFSREKEDHTFGQGSQYVPGLLLYWQNRYYISILFNPETAEAKNTAIKIARHIESGIQSKGSLPEILTLLPQESLQKESIRYFRHHIWINTYQFISNENILHINDSAHAALAKYGQKDDRQLLLLVQYPDKQKAESAYAHFLSTYFRMSSCLPGISGTTIIENKDNWNGCKIVENLLIIVLDAQRKESVEKLIDQIKNKL